MSLTSCMQPSASPFELRAIADLRRASTLNMIGGLNFVFSRMALIACNSAAQLGSREWIGVVKATIDSVAAAIAELTSGFFAILYIVFSFF